MFFRFVAYISNILLNLWWRDCVELYFLIDSIFPSFLFLCMHVAHKFLTNFLFVFCLFPRWLEHYSQAKNKNHKNSHNLCDYIFHRFLPFFSTSFPKKKTTQKSSRTRNFSINSNNLYSIDRHNYNNNSKNHTKIQNKSNVSKCISRSHTKKISSYLYLYYTVFILFPFHS